MRRKINSKSNGQVLIIVILVSLVLLSIGLSVIQQNIDETKITKLQEENKRALSVAEAGIEALLKDTSGKKSIALGGGSSILSDVEGIQGKAVVQEGSSNIFTTPLLRKDDTFTTYLIPYNQINTITTNSVNFTITHTLSSCADSNSKFALELTFLSNTSVSSTPTSITRYIDCGGVISGNDLWDNTTPESQILLIRVIAPSENFPGVKVILTKSLGDNWPLQGKTIISSVTTSTGVVKTIQLFQSYPQIPGDFYITKF